MCYRSLFMRCSALCRSQRYLNSSQAMQDGIFRGASGSAALFIYLVPRILTGSLVAVPCACGVDRLQAENGLFGSPVSLGALQYNRTRLHPDFSHDRFFLSKNNRVQVRLIDTLIADVAPISPPHMQRCLMDPSSQPAPCSRILLRPQSSKAPTINTSI
jgi:hypothetical protein